MKQEIRIDGLDRIHIPKKMQKEMNWTAGDTIIATLDQDRITLTSKPIDSKCPVCSAVFTSEFKFCPYCGQYLEVTKHEDSNA